MPDTQTAAAGRLERGDRGEPDVVVRDGVPFVPDDEFLAAAQIETARWRVLLERLAE